MARKDVELVIRAKNEATKAVDSVKEALESLVTAQSTIAASASKTDSALTRLGTALTGLNKAFKGESGAAKIAAELDKAFQASARLGAEARATAADLDRLQRDASNAATQTARLKQEAQDAATGLKQQQVAVKDAKDAQKQLGQSIRETTAERDKAAATDTRLTAAIAKQEGVVTKVGERYRELAARVAATTEPTKTLQNQLEAASKALEKQHGKMAGLIERHTQNQAVIARTGQTLNGLQVSLTQANDAFDRQVVAVTRAKEAHTQTATAAQASATNLKAIQAAADAGASALERQTKALDHAQAEYGQLVTAASQADVAMTQLAAHAGGALTQAFTAQRRAMLDTKREWQTAQGAVKDLAQAMDRVAEPNAAMVASFDRARAAAALAKREYQTQQAALAQMSGVLRGAGTDLDALRTKQEAFARIQVTLGSTMAKLRSDAEAAAKANQALGAGGSAAGRGLNTAGQAARTAGGAIQTASAQTISFASALRSLYGESRTAMSWAQRLRGEILSLTASYVGFFAAVQGVKDVVGAFSTLEAAQSRLNVVAEGNKDVIAKDLDFIRRNANRLGIEFGQLADQYTKFAVSTKGTALAGDATKKIFISVAEAGRVNKLSLEDLQGIFTALSQIAGKSAVQMEELRQQLGDRLPGAVQLMADGMGVGVDVLIKMMEQGKVSSTALIGFADALDRRFGKSLPQALESTSTQLGKLQNSAFQALLVVGQSSFIEKFTDFVKDLNAAISSSAAISFFERLGVALGALMDVLAAAVNHFQLVFGAMTAVIGIKMTPFVLALIAQFNRLLTPTVAVTAGMSTMAVQATATAGTMGVLGRSVVGLRAALTALTSSTGIGLLVTGISIAIGAWATRTDSATEALTSHQKVLDRLKDAYDKAGKSAKNWAEEVAKGNQTQAIANVAALRTELQSLRDSVKAPVDAFGTDTTGVVREIKTVIDAFKQGSITAVQFREKIDALAQANPKLNRNLALGLLGKAEDAAVLAKKVEEAEAVLAVLNGTATESQVRLVTMGESVDESAAALLRAQQAAKKFKEGLDAIKSKIPELTTEMKRLKDLAEVQTLFEAAKREATTPAQVTELETARDTAVATINNEAAEKIAKAITEKIVAVESGGRAIAKNADSSATGAGQFIKETWLELFKKYFPDRAANLNDTMMLELRKDATLSKKMVEAYATENAKVLQKAGLTVTEASLYLAHFLGPNGAVKVLKKFAEDPNAPVSDVVSKDAVNANQRILKGKSVGDVIGFANEAMGITDAQVSMVQEVVKLQDKEIDNQVKFNEEVRAGNEERVFEAAQAKLTNAGQDRQAAINAALHEAEAKALKNKVTLEQADRQAIIDTTGALFDQTKAQEIANKKVDELVALRSELREQFELAQQTGDTAAEDATYQAILAVNGQLELAIQNAIKMWEAIGGPAADAAIAKLKTMSVTTQTSGQQALIRWKEVGEYAAGGLANAFDSFAQKVVEGQSAFTAARDAFLQFASDFLRMIAQMIIQTIILNALKNAFPGTFGVGVAHGGGLAGSPNRSRQVSPAWFGNAIRYHNGGIAGLRPNEVPTILERNEEVLTTSDPRHRFNIGSVDSAGSSAAPVQPKIVNAFDTASFLEAALNSKVGERAILNFVRANPGAFKAALG